MMHVKQMRHGVEPRDSRGPFSTEQMAANPHQQQFQASGKEHRPVVPGSKKVYNIPHPTDRAQGKHVTGLAQQPEPRTRGLRHFPPREREFYSGVRMDKKIKVQDQRSGAPYVQLRSGTYHFNDLYGNVRSEVWEPHQSRTFSHHELVFPTRSSVKQEEVNFMASKHKNLPSYQLVVKPEIQERGIIKNGAAARYHRELLKQTIVDRTSRRINTGSSRGSSR